MNQKLGCEKGRQGPICQAVPGASSDVTVGRFGAITVVTQVAIQDREGRQAMAVSHFHSDYIAFCHHLRHYTLVQVTVNYVFQLF